MANVVLVEDDDDLRSSLGECLQLLGHMTTGAQNAVELYQLIAMQSFDVAVVDINLPYYDGFSIVEYLCSNADLRIIIASVRGDLSDRVRGYQSGADIYMTKPVDPEELAAAIVALTQSPSRNWRGRWIAGARM
ncbi:response regulator transcription factor [Amorphus sp. MBR-141]